MSKSEIEVHVVTRDIGSGKPKRCSSNCQLRSENRCVLGLEANAGIVGPRCLKDGKHLLVKRTRVIRPEGKPIVKSGIKEGG